MVKFTKTKPETSGPTSALGIMQFFDTDSKSPQLNPWFVVGFAIIFVIFVLVLKFLGR